MYNDNIKIQSKCYTHLQMITNMSYMYIIIRQTLKVFSYYL